MEFGDFLQTMEQKQQNILIKIRQIVAERNALRDQVMQLTAERDKLQDHLTKAEETIVQLQQRTKKMRKSIRDNYDDEIKCYDMNSDT